MCNKKFSGLIFLLVAQVSLSADWLVTPMESKHEAMYGHSVQDIPVPKAIFDPSAPYIEVVQPSLQKNLKTPFQIQVVFKTNDGTRINPSTFKAMYGAFKVDITDRILKHAKVTQTGIFVSEANIPSGSHKIVLSVEDVRSRRAEAELRFKVD